MSLGKAQLSVDGGEEVVQHPRQRSRLHFRCDALASVELAILRRFYVSQALARRLTADTAYCSDKWLSRGSCVRESNYVAIKLRSITERKTVHVSDK